MMPTLHLMVGLPCSGKTTLARKLEQECSALRFTPDEWHTRLFGLDLEDFEAHNVRHDVIENMLWELAARALSLGVNVILDFGFWAKEERDFFRARAFTLGASCQIHYLDVSNAELLERLKSRNANLPAGTFNIPEQMLEEWITSFQAPTPEELEPHHQNQWQI
jgi:predicted kinase